MNERTYHTMDKSSWGSGPWIEEPDKVQFKDEVTGYPCLIKRNHYGALCGYVGVSPGHPLYGVNYNEADSLIENYPHGGLTYSDYCADGDEATSICHVPDPGEPDHVFWFGFDCAHYFDLAPGMKARLGELEIDLNPLRDEHYRDIDYVRAECVRLARELKQKEIKDE